jgi:hypothetical protein
MDQSNNNNTNDNGLSPTWMQQAALSLEPQPQDQGQAIYHFDDSTLDENNIDSWLQSGGLGCSPMVVATDQELAGKSLRECPAPLSLAGGGVLRY